jgi:hypothetical protein
MRFFGYFWGMELLKHPLLNGPRRVNGKKAPTCEGPKLDDNLPRLFALWMDARAKKHALEVGLEAPARILEPGWPEFDSRKHGLLAPPRMRYSRRGQGEPPF